MSNYNSSMERFLARRAKNESNYAKKMLHGYRGSKESVPMAILTAENPNAKQLPPAENNARNKELETYLKSGGYLYKKIKGFYGVEEGALPEHSFIVAGLPLQACKNVSKKYGQQSFIYVTRTFKSGNKPRYQMWAINRQGEYVMVDEKDRIDYVPGFNDFYSQAGDFRGNIPFTKFEPDEAMEELDDILESLGERRKQLYYEGVMENSPRQTGYSRYAARRTALGNLTKEAFRLYTGVMKQHADKKSNKLLTIKAQTFTQ